MSLLLYSISRLHGLRHFINNSPTSITISRAANFVYSYSWVIYGIMTNDIYIGCSTALGCMVASFSLNTGFILIGNKGTEKELEYLHQMESILMLGMFVWILIGLRKLKRG
jgi:hypothetical protein